MKSGLILPVFAAIMLLLGGCSITPDTITHQRTGQTRYQQAQQHPGNGSIYQPYAFRPIYDDHKARMLGDNLTVVITESNRSTKSGDGSNERTNQATVTKPRFFGSSFDKAAASADGSVEYEEKASKTANNLFNGTIAVTVIEVTPNGNLVVSGEKQIAMDTGSEFIRFSGVVDPKDVTIGNQVLSTKVADARIEYRTNTTIDAADVVSRMSRFFLSVMPF
ncbi:MAG: flagellar basal body L-ring protein FlgH [Burkholderiaceae bacterium]|jgi:flagellar L-ring protein precursor FlgH|nr:flagellar basal body L-ring protein FlgH [Burkholderiaceae bacterium]